MIDEPIDYDAVRQRFPWVGLVSTGEGELSSRYREITAEVAVSCTQKRLPSLTDALLDAAITGVVREVSDAEIQRIRLIDHRIDVRRRGHLP